MGIFFTVRSARVIMKVKLFSMFLIIGCILSNCSEQKTSEIVNFPQKTEPSIPTGVTVGNASQTSLDITWNSVSDAESYQVYWDSSSSGTFTQLSHTTASTMVTHTGLTSNTTYYYKVKAINSVGSSGFSAVASGMTAVIIPPLDTIPATPSGLKTGNSTTSSVVVSWTAEYGAVSYQLYRSINSDMTSSTLIYDGVENSIEDTGLLYGGTYYYAVKATNSYGSSNLSGPVSGTALSLAPTGLAIGNAASDRLVAFWNTVDRAKLYQIHRSLYSDFTSSSSFEVVGPPFVDTGLASKKKYYYRVRVINNGGAGAWSNTAFGTTL